jgi:hypothetical protein
MRLPGVCHMLVHTVVVACLLGPLTEQAQAGTAVAVVPATTSSGGLSLVGGIVGIASFLGIYDVLRRTTCLGDPLILGGPGFGQPIRPSDNVLVPRACPVGPRR